MGDFFGRIAQYFKDDTILAILNSVLMLMSIAELLFPKLFIGKDASPKKIRNIRILGVILLVLITANFVLIGADVI